MVWGFGVILKGQYVGASPKAMVQMGFLLMIALRSFLRTISVLQTHILDLLLRVNRTSMFKAIKQMKTKEEDTQSKMIPRGPLRRM